MVSKSNDQGGAYEYVRGPSPHPPRGVKHLPRRARVLQALLRRALGARLQTLTGALQRVRLGALPSGVLGWVGGGGGAEPGTHHLTARVHGAEPAGPGRRRCGRLAGWDA